MVSSPCDSPQCQGTSDAYLPAACAAPGTCSCLPQVGCGESLCTSPRNRSLHLSGAGRASPAVWRMTAPCSHKQWTSGEAHSAAANDKESLKVVAMNEFEEPSSPCFRLDAAAVGSTVWISTLGGPAPGGGPASSHSRCHSVLSPTVLLGFCRLASYSEAGTLRCLFATRLAGVPSGLLIAACDGAGALCAGPEHSGALEPAQVLPCLCNAGTARTRAHHGLKGQP